MIQAAGHPGTALLAARDARERDLSRCLDRNPGGTCLALGTNLPGPRKYRPGLARLVAAGLDALRAGLDLEVVVSRRDALGPFFIGVTGAPPRTAKRAAVGVEASLAAGRLLDLDVYGPEGVQVNRAALGLPARTCFVCGEAAQECMRVGRHGQDALERRVDALLASWRPAPCPIDLEALAVNLPLGARRELDLTPKPGLVDRRDRGSHPDLSHAAMATSVDLLPRYCADLLACARQGRPLGDWVRAGLEAEDRMVRSIASNAHKGYIFLSGLVLMAAWGSGGCPDLLRPQLAEAARVFFAGFGPAGSHGAVLRGRLGLGGVRAEAERGLPAVFEHGWPAYREALEAGWGPDQAGFYLMAVLMQTVEDSTAVHRCGTGGLDLVRRDGRRLQRLLEAGRNPEPWLAARNRAYVEAGLTMGGVADCMALVFALEGCRASG